MSLSQSDKEAKKFLESYMGSRTPAHHEAAGQKIWLDYLSQFMDPKLDYIDDDGSYGSVAAIIHGSKNNYKVVLDAHVDEVSWFVRHIEGDGRIGLATNGSPDFDAALGNRVHIQNKKGDLFTGVFQRAATHVRSEEDKATLENSLVFIGANSKEEVLQSGIQIGSPVTIDADMIEFGMGKKKTHITGRALDDKICGYINTQVVRNLKEQNIVLPYQLCVVNSVQEETNRMGAKFMAEKLKPNAAFVLDVTFDTNSGDYNQASCGHMVMDGGPALCVSAPMHPKLNEFVENVAKKSGIEIQYEPLHTGEHSGTNADPYFAANIPTTLISLPIQNMHTPVETASWQDINSLILLMTETLKDIKGDKSQFDVFANQRKAWASKFKNQPKF